MDCEVTIGVGCGCLLVIEFIFKYTKHDNEDVNKVIKLTIINAMDEIS
jgi:hypothetical protein